jgi:zinc and cadmium transporter
VIGLSAISGIGATAGVGAVFLLGPRVLGIIPSVIHFATGTLLAGACLGLLPQALEHHDATFEVMLALLGGLIGFALLERLLIWRHRHERTGETSDVPGYLILLGDAIHNLMDGIAIASAYQVSPALAIPTALAVAAHEIPQEVGDFGILLDSGFGRVQAFVLNILSASTAIGGAVGAYLASSAIQGMLHVLRAVAASSFLFVALADLVPFMRKGVGAGGVLR